MQSSKSTRKDYKKGLENSEYDDPFQNSANEVVQWTNQKKGIIAMNIMKYPIDSKNDKFAYGYWLGKMLGLLQASLSISSPYHQLNLKKQKMYSRTSLGICYQKEILI